MADDDIDDLKRRVACAERERSVSDERLRVILQGIGDQFYLLDRDWRFLFASRSALEAWGKRQDDIVGQVFLKAFPQAEGSAAYESAPPCDDDGRGRAL